MYVTMTDLLKKAESNGYAVGAFNIVNELTTAAVIDAAVTCRSPLILQTSQKTVDVFGPERLVGFVKPLAEAADVPVALHLDHCTKPELAKACVDAGYSSIMIDMSKMPFEENVRISRDVAQYAIAKGCSVEGEIGAIVGVEDDIKVAAKDASLANPESCMQFVEQTGVTALAPAIGTAHGLYKGEPKIDFELFEELRKCIPVPLVVHGGTGLSDEVFHRLIDMGASKVNISTALKMAYCGSIDEYLKANAKRDPLALDKAAYAAVKEMALAHMHRFRSEGRV